MTKHLIVSSGHYTSAGVKASNDDACGITIPGDNTLITKGIAAAIADGMSGSEAGKEAAEASVKGFLSDYFSTPESWSVESSASKILSALNRWLYSQGQNTHDSICGMVTTLSTLIIKSASIYIFHIGDTRIYRLRNGELELLTRDHRLVISEEKNYLSRAMGIDLHIEIDYQSAAAEINDIYLMTTDGIHDFVSDTQLKACLLDYKTDLTQVAEHIGQLALDHHSGDNVTCQILKIDQLPTQDSLDLYHVLTELPFPPSLEPGMRMDGYKILKEIHASKRTQVYIALDEKNERKVVIKTPSINYEDEPEYIDHFLHEEWAGKRIKNAHVLKIYHPERKRQFLYYVTEYIEGQTLRQWMIDNPHPPISTVRDIVQQIIQGLRGFHRQEMLHQDLKPENIMIDLHGLITLIDFGSTKIAGIEEITTPWKTDRLLGTESYTAPEYLQGHVPSNQSDQFSLGVICYELLTGKLPYGKDLNIRNLNKLRYIAASKENPEIPLWMDKAIEKSVHRIANRRYPHLSEFLHDLSQPNEKLIQSNNEPLIEKNPVAVWRGISLLLLIINMILFYQLS